jgi:hypothetical protein
VTQTRTLLQFPWRILVNCHFRDVCTFLQFPWCIQLRCCHSRDIYSPFLQFPWHSQLLPFPWLIHYVLEISVTHVCCYHFRDTNTYDVAISVTHVLCCNFHETYTYFLAISVTYAYVFAIFMTRRRTLLTLVSRFLSVLTSQDSSDFFATPNIT